MSAARLAAALAAGAIGALLTVGLAAPAQAGILESGSWTFENSFTFDDCGFDVAAHEHFEGSYTIKDSNPRTDGQFFRLQQRITFFGTFTNTETEDFFTIEWRQNVNELPATLVGDDGRTVTYRTHEAGVWDMFRDSSGKVRYLSAGNVVFEYVFDTLGDSEPSGEVLDETLVRLAGTFPTFDADFCAIVEDLIG
jgi:hypothetical protein